VGAPVYRNADEVIGMVSTVYPRSALVTLFSTPGFTAAAYIDETNLLVTVEGLGGGVTRVQVPQGVPLQVGALVYLPTIQPGVIGRISAIENEPTQPQQFGYLVSDTAFRQLRYVSVGEPTDVRSDVSAIEKYVATIREAVAVPAALEVATTTATSSTSTVPTTSPETQ